MFGPWPPLPSPASWLSYEPVPCFSVTQKRLSPQGLAKPGARSSLVPRKAGSEVTGSRISVALWVLRMPESVAGTCHRMTWGPLGAPKAIPAPRLCLYPRVSSAAVVASAELTP